MIQAALAALIAAAATPALAANQDFQLVNRKGYQIDEVYVGPHSSRSWGEDVMGNDALANGERVNITFPNRTSACSFDIKVIYHDKDEATWESVNLCQVSKVSLFWRNGATRGVTE